MLWTSDHDILPCQKVLFQNPYQKKKGSSQRSILWEKIAESLNGLSSPSLNVGKRAVCDHVGILINRYKRRIKAEEKASGISPGEPTELDNMLEEIITLEETANVEEHEASCEKRGEMDKDRAKVEAMRLKAMETSETKRTSDDMDGKKDRQNYEVATKHSCTCLKRQKRTVSPNKSSEKSSKSSRERG